MKNRVAYKKCVIGNEGPRMWWHTKLKSFILDTARVWNETNPMIVFHMSLNRSKNGIIENSEQPLNYWQDTQASVTYLDENEKFSISWLN